MRPETLKIIERPLTEPVTLTEAKVQVGLVADLADFDDLLVRAISTARRVVEQRLGITLLATQYRATWPAGARELHLPAGPLLQGSGYDLVVTVGEDELAETAYEVLADAMPPRVSLNATAGERVTVTYWAGHETAQELEPQLRSAILMHVDHQFENRGVLAEGTSAELPAGFEMLLASCSYSGGF